MTAQQGFLYEENAARVLKKYNIVPDYFTPAGSGSDKPDLMIVYKNKESGCELKISEASAGSLVLKYNSKNKKNPWQFGEIKPNEEEKMFIRDLAEEVKLFDLINKKWNKVPMKRDRDATWDATVGKLTPEQRYKSDLANFVEIKGEISAEKIEKYYNKKKTYYVNVGSHGFYMLGRSNPLSLKGIPTFASSAKAMYRARVQYKGGGNYQFTFEMKFSMKSKSPYNIAPTKSKGSVDIDIKALNLSPFVN